MKNQAKGIALATITSCLWGILAILLKIALGHFDPFTIVWFRFVVAFLSLTMYLSATRPELLQVLKKPPKMMLLAALFLSGNYISYMKGIYFAGPGATQIILQSGAVLLGIVGFVFFKEKLNLTRGAGFIIAITGFVVFYSYQIAEIGADADKNNFVTGVMWVLLASVSWTAYAVTNKKLVETWPSQQSNLIVFGVPILLFLPTVDFGLFLQSHEWWVWLLMVGLGLNTVIAYGTLAAAFQHAEANRISIIITVNPIITFVLLEIMMLLDVQWFPITPVPVMAFVGAALVIWGAIMAVGLKQNEN